MATFRKFKRRDGSNTFQAIVRREGMRARYATFPTKRDAERWSAKLEGDFARYRHFPDEESSRRTLNEAIDRWVREELPSKRSAKSIANTLGWWKRRIGDKTLAAVTPAVLSEIKSELASGTFTRATPGSRYTSLKKGTAAPQYRRSASTVNRYLQAVGSVLTHCEREWSWLQDNPMRRVRKLKQPQGRVRYLTDGERIRLLSAAADVDRHLHAFILLALATGARAGELLALTWRDVDFKRGRAVLQRSKNDDRRALTLAGPALESLKNLRRVRRIGVDRIFVQSDGDRAYAYDKPFRAAIAAAGIKDFRFHDLRHTAASWLAMTGATGPEIAAVLGHRTLQMVKRYAHLGEQHVAGVVERMVAEKLS